MTALPPAARKGLIYALIAMGLAVSAARIAMVENDLGNTPFLSANDRSRWAAMAALVHERTSIVDRPQTYKDPSTKKTDVAFDRSRNAFRQ